MELKKKDMELLSYLYHSGRESINKIAKECKFSREQVNYKLRKFREAGLIKGFVTLFNYPSLGYNLWATLLIKARETPNLSKIKNIINTSEIIGYYDYYISFVAKNETDLKETIHEILKENGGLILEYKLIKPYFTEMYPLKFIENKRTFNFLENFEKQNLTKQDIKILSLLEKNARIKIIDLASKLNISSELALYKLRNLHKKKIILGTKVDFDITKLGFYYSMISIDLFHFSKELEEKIKSFVKSSKFVNSLILSFENPRVMIQVFNKTQEELLSTISKIKKLFGENLKKFDLMFLEQEKEINTLPDLD
ncbi:MAG: Lrp/AsnC family transcriptional regulator [Nanoarchaeota archaeon]|nr:Lrp/AsnC family transcriptional regulator [Nanoarchaeota archaeon]